MTQIGKHPAAADTLKINLGVPPTATPNRFGVIGGDNAGFPNGRRLGDDVVDIELRVVGGFLKGNKLPLGDGVDRNDVPFRSTFPYVRLAARRLRLAAQARPSPAHAATPGDLNPPDAVGTYRPSPGGAPLRERAPSASPLRAMTLARPNLVKLLAVAAAFAGRARRVRPDRRRSERRRRGGLVDRRRAGLPRPGASTDELIRALPGRGPGGAARRRGLRAALAGAYLQKVRETGDAGFYTRADAVLRQRPPRSRRTTTACSPTAGTLALARHDFAGGLRYGLGRPPRRTPPPTRPTR